MTTPVTPMTIKQAADHLGLTIWEVREMTERGELPYAMLNGRRFVAREDLGPATAGSLMARRFGWNVTATHGIHAEELGRTVKQTMTERGVSMGDMQAKLLSKVEELTLHLIRMEKENAALRERVQVLETASVTR